MQGKMWLYARNVIFWKNLAAQGMYWRILFWKQISKAMLKLVCWLYSQVLAAFYFLPWFQVTFWEGTQTMRKSWADMGQPLTDLHCFFPMAFGNFGQKLQKPREKKNQRGSMSGRDIGLVFFLHFCLFSWFVFNKTNPCVVCDQIKIRLFKLSHMQKSCTPTVPCSVNFRHK